MVVEAPFAENSGRVCTLSFLSENIPVLAAVHLTDSVVSFSN